MDDFGLTFGIKEYDEYGNLVETSAAASVKGWITFIFLIGCALGCVVVAFLTDKFGRKWSILLGGSFFTIGGVIQAIVGNEIAWYGGRCVSGVGIGILSSVVPMYISETAPTQIRGRLITVQQLMVFLFPAKN
jgi:MFS family permease